MKFYQDKRSVEFKVGLFTLLAIIILVLGYSWLMEVMENRKYTEIEVKFENAGNIEQGSAVSILGVKKGRVKDISIASDGVTLNLQVELDFPLKENLKNYVTNKNVGKWKKNLSKEDMKKLMPVIREVLKSEHYI